MKYIIFIILALGTYKYVNEVTNSDNMVSMDNSTTDKVVVYGRSTCSITQQVMNYMGENHIDYYFENIDDIEVADKLHVKMKSQGLSTKSYNLPVVDFYGELSIRPSRTKILDSKDN